ncbi:MAG: hypothetical protein LJE59_03045 [Chromatiaceae bacterium]|nr:hypothetical protein [Chromatiaceae bacterium]
MLASLGHAAAAGQRLTVLPAWDGRFLPGEETELSVELAADLGGNYRIQVSSAAFHLQQQGSIEPGRPVVVALPVRPAPDGRLDLQLAGPGDSSASQVITLRPAGAPLRIDASADRSRSRNDPAELQTGPQRLPSTLSGYAPVGHLSLDRAAVSRLDAAQRQALTGYLGRCGALQFAADAQDLLVPSQALAACGAAQFSAADAAPRAGRSTFLGEDKLRALLDGAPGLLGARWVPAACGLYVLVLVALPRRQRQPSYVVAIAVLASLGVAAYAAWRPPSAQGVVVVEAHNGAEQGRLSALLRVHGDGLHASSVMVDGRLSTPLALGGADTSLAILPTPTAHFEIAVRPPFLGLQDYALSGVAPLTSRAVLRIAPGGLELANQGPQPIPAGLLAVADRVVATPALATGARWLVDPAAPTPAWTPAAGLLRELALHDGATWMLPLAPTEGRAMAPVARHTGWLLIHEPGQAL